MEILIEKFFTVKLRWDCFFTSSNCSFSYNNSLLNRLAQHHKINGAKWNNIDQASSWGSPAANNRKHLRFLRQSLSDKSFCKWFQSEKCFAEYQRVQKVLVKTKRFVFSCLKSARSDLLFRLMNFLMKMDEIPSFVFFSG